MTDCVCPLATLGNILHFSITFDIEGYVVNLLLLKQRPKKVTRTIHKIQFKLYPFSPSSSLAVRTCHRMYISFIFTTSV